MESLTDNVYNLIYEDILMVRLKPGQRLHIAGLAKQYGVGLSPVREALSRLTATDFVVATPQKGFRVAEASQKDLEDLYATRTAVEEIALKMAIEKGDESWEAGIMAAYHRLSQYEKRSPLKSMEDYQEWEKRHRAFNLALITACGLCHLLQIQEKLYRQTERYRRLWLLAGLEGGKPLRYAIRQKPLMDAVLARDSDKACFCLREHFKKAQIAISKLI
ncbi:MAG: FCD domain-containing protein [Parachlamydia sp.]|nr:FCD domain-containing protein [Parachlamydia sp.]